MQTPIDFCPKSAPFMKLTEGQKACDQQSVYSDQFELHLEYRHLWLNGGYTDNEKVHLNEIFRIVTKISKNMREKCDRDMQPDGTIVVRPLKTLLNPDAVIAIKFVHNLLVGRGKDHHVVTLVDLRNPDCPADYHHIHPTRANAIRLRACPVLSDHERTEIDIGESYSRKNFIDMGGVGYAVYPDRDICNPSETMGRKACLLYGALIKATCQNFSNSLGFFEEVILLFSTFYPDEEINFP